jgi:tetratricopeptide (TPR) repeat protein
METLRGLLEQDPANSRFRYMLAMELVNTGDLSAAVGEFTALLEKDPTYGAGYYHGGQTLEKLGRVEDARALYRRGIAATGQSGDAHTQSELQGALDLIS